MTMLQRIGTGIFISIFTLVFAAVAETKRLKTAQKYGVVDEPNTTIPMSVWGLIPQYLLFGISDVFTMVGLQEFFHHQIPNTQKNGSCPLLEYPWSGELSKRLSNFSD
ncbi:NRT1/ PTR FAMILY 5.10 [Spatholobus suberectus]|nr:NRT1/ PTR FAMILY 5.10 [Spatholobus suberectus]